ncbi:MAG: phosphoribosylanthranilate isomerase [Burkholderiaceae bacterium]
MNPTPSLFQRTRIKICGITREADLDAAVAAGADAVGFVLYPPSPRFVTPERAAELARRLPPFVTPVLLFVNASASELRAANDVLPCALLQFHGDETPQQCLEASHQGRHAWIRAARIPAGREDAFDLLKFAANFHSAQAILLDAHVEGYGGGGTTFNWSRLPPSVESHLVLSGGLHAANVIDGLQQVWPRCRKTLAVDVSSGVEGPVKGIKDAARIHQFVAAVRAADEQRLAKAFHHADRIPPT